MGLSSKLLQPLVKNIWRDHAVMHISLPHGVLILHESTILNCTRCRVVLAVSSQLPSQACLCSLCLQEVPAVQDLDNLVRLALLDSVDSQDFLGIEVRLVGQVDLVVPALLDIQVRIIIYLFI